MFDKITNKLNSLVMSDESGRVIETVKTQGKELINLVGKWGSIVCAILVVIAFIGAIICSAAVGAKMNASKDEEEVKKLKAKIRWAWIGVGISVGIFALFGILLATAAAIIGWS
ncbi:Mbov_0395 family pilin-like conjugal transfer protein [[Mycoplasma] anseris]|uniref:Uncharacterized protein n=1 Tax=[Mycoplasma] anseris TaxID=92400 RepID=A0A2Z4NCX4_9BACT|nr:hypothetical protein [[Mycoplasma] anseris]AWX69418.1 hypothetical protein DP065_01455 [[Mycoplasma] anseris]